MNKLIKSLIYGGDVSLSVLETTELVNKAIQIHNLTPSAGVTLGGLLTACAYMSGCLKSEVGAVSLTVKSADGLGSVSVSGDINLNIRGYIDCEGEGKLKGGYLTVIKDDGFFRPFVGTCELISDDVSQNLMHYFDKSEQIPTAVAIGVEIQGGVCVCAGGVVMQMMPGFKQESMDAAEEAMQSFVDVKSVLKELGADGIMEKFFSEDIKKMATYSLFPEYKCNCSRKKIEERVITPLGREEAENIIAEEGKISVHCHYCNTDHIFTAKDIEKLFKK